MTTSDYNHYFIPVDISKGMFSSEFGVSLKLADGNIVSFFADKELFKQQADNKWLMRVSLVKQEDNKALVLLPVEPFETASRWAEVSVAA